MTEAAVNDYKESLKTKAENLLLKEFPQKIVKLNEMLSKLNFHEVSLGAVYEDVNIPIPRSASESGEPRSKKRRLDISIMMANPAGASTSAAKVYTLPNGPAPCNRSLSQIIRIVKPHIRELVEDSNIVKMWIAYLIPKMESADNLGVEIQGTILKAIHESESKGEEFLETITDYFVTRAKIVSKVAKYPHIEDYRRAVKELDEKQFLMLWLTISEIRNRYCVMHDLVTKNLDKIKMPRISVAATLY